MKNPGICPACNGSGIAYDDGARDCHLCTRPATPTPPYHCGGPMGVVFPRGGEPPYWICQARGCSHTQPRVA